MESWQSMYTRFENMAQDSDASHLVIGKSNINLGNKILQKEIGMPAMKAERTISTLTSTNAYPLPQNFQDLDELYVTVSSQRYYAEREYNEDAWKNYMLRPNQVVSDILSHVFVRPGIGKFEIYPIAATASNSMTMIYSAFDKDLSADDYTTGTLAITSGGTTVTGSGTTFTAAMVGRWLKTTDGEWYKIATYTSATSIALLQPYQGATITSGACTIGEMPRIPAGTHHIPVYFALWQHFLGVKRDPDMAKVYKSLWDESRLWAVATFSNLYSSGVIPSQRRKMRSRMKDPNDYPNLSSA